MTTQTRRTTRQSAKFLRTTIKVHMVMACCGLVLLSAVSAQAGVDGNGLYLNGLPIQGLPGKEGTLPMAQSVRLPWSTLSQQGVGMSTP